MRASLVLLASLLMLPSGVAQRGWILGTEEIPELPDASGDVEYDPLYTGAKDHAYIDMLAAWFSYENQTDKITATIKTANGQQLASAPAGWEVSCRFSGNVSAEGAVQGALSFRWVKPYNASDLRTSVSWDPTPNQTVVSQGGNRQLRHDFSADFSQPGYFRFSTDRLQLLQLGDSFDAPTGGCFEFYALRAGVYTGVMSNSDPANSKAAYSFVELRRTKSPEGIFDPIERLPTEDAEPTPTSSDVGGSPAPGFLLALIVSAFGAVFLKGRRR